MQEDVPDFAIILETLAQYEVDFIVVGGVCAVLLGAPIATFDLDIVHSRNIENLSRLEKALNALEAYYREHLPKQIKPSVQNLATSGHHLLLTKYGPLDVLGSIGTNDSYQALISNIETIPLSEHHSIDILNLDTLIDVKTKTAREKDQSMLSILNAMKEEQ